MLGAQGGVDRGKSYGHGRVRAASSARRRRPDAACLAGAEPEYHGKAGQPRGNKCNSIRGCVTLDENRFPSNGRADESKGCVFHYPANHGRVEMRPQNHSCRRGGRQRCTDKHHLPGRCQPEEQNTKGDTQQHNCKTKAKTAVRTVLAVMQIGAMSAFHIFTCRWCPARECRGPPLGIAPSRPYICFHDTACMGPVWATGRASVCDLT